MANRKARSPQNRPSKKRPGRESRPEGTLRVIGGRLRGSPIQYLGDPLTRPMKQRVREAAFNLLGKRVAGTHVIDLFAGTGALAWEALSRGAASATLLERHFPSARVIRQNAATLGLADQVEVIAGDTFFWARKVDSTSVAPVANRPWLVFCSPPYDLFAEEAGAICALLEQLIQVAPPQSLVVAESDRRFDTTLLPGPMAWDVRPYPPAVLAVAQTGDREPNNQ